MVFFWSFLVSESTVAWFKKMIFLSSYKMKESLLRRWTLKKGGSDSNVILTLNVVTWVWMPHLKYHCRFLQPGLISSTIFHKKFARFSYCQPYKIYKLITGSFPNDWKRLLRTEFSQKSLLKIFCYNNKKSLGK